MGKLGRSYSLTIGPTFQIDTSGAIDAPPILVDPTILVIPMVGTTIPIPLSLEFDIERQNLTNAGHFVLKIYGLGENNRNFIRKDYSQTYLYKRCQLKAGYGPVLSTIAQGNINRAFSFRGDSGWVTQIEGFDGGFDYLNSDTNLSFGAGTPVPTIIAALTQKLSFIRQGIIGPIAASSLPLDKGEAHVGSTLDLLDDVTSGSAFVDLETLHILADSECLEGPLPVIDSKSGLLGTPIWQDAFLTIEMIFEPRVIVGQMIVLNSLSGFVPTNTTQVNRTVNGQWKVVGIKHRGMISDTVAGDALTSLSLSQGTGILTVVGAA